MAASGTLTLDMPSLSRLERLQLAELRLREIQNEAAEIYRRFPELDQRPKLTRSETRRPMSARQTAAAAWAAKLH